MLFFQDPLIRVPPFRVDGASPQDAGGRRSLLHQVGAVGGHAARHIPARHVQGVRAAPDPGRGYQEIELRL